MPMKMTQEERAAFLNEVHVAVISVPDPGRGPLAVPVWYAYVPQDEFHIWTGGDSHKVALLREAGRCSICVQQETPPYKYVSVEGPVAMEPIQLERDLRPLVYRYLGPEEGQAYIEGLGGDTAGTGDLLIRVKPERWRTLDFSKNEA